MRKKHLYASVLTVMLVFFVVMSLTSQGRDTMISELGDDYMDDKMPEREKDFAERGDVDERDVVALSGIYVNEVYRVSDSLIRFVYLEHRDNRKSLEALVSGVWTPVRWFCYNRTCNDTLFCDVASRIGAVFLPKGTPSFDRIDLSVKGNDEYFTVNVRDVRPKAIDTYDHHVGVCMQPIFFYTNWPLLIQFFESWLAQGVTKFYFYVHSYSKQSKKVLDFYKAQLGDDLELIDWSDLPAHHRDRGDYYRDVNSRIFRHGATAFMHDCMLRARSSVKWIANFDLDDFPVSWNRNIGSALDEISSQSSEEVAQVVVDWRLAKQQMSWDRMDSPSDVSFSLSSARLIANNSVRWDYRVSNKMFHRPERTLHFDMHTVYKNEKIAGTGKRYRTLFALGDHRLFSLHLRPFERHFRQQNISLDMNFDYSQLSLLERVMKENYSRRIKDSEFKDEQMSPWAAEARETMRNLEQCRRESFGTQLTGRNQMCQQSSAGCAGMLSAGIVFEKAPLMWTNLAHTALFNSYVEK